MPQVKEKRYVELIEARMSEEGNGSLTGYILRFNDLNSHGEVNLPGCSLDTQATFLRDGFITDSHDWDSVGGLIGIPTSLSEDKNGVLATFAFHSTDIAQRARTVARERIENGKSVGLSIGFSWNDDVVYLYPNQYADKLAPLLRADQRTELLQQAMGFTKIRVLPTVNLFEYSLVTVPSQPNAMATQVRSKEQIKLIRSACPLITKCMEARGEYLGDDICGYVSLDALQTLFSSLCYGALGGYYSGGILFDDDDPFELKMTQVDAAIDEFATLSKQLIRAIMQFDQANNPDTETLGEIENISLAARGLFGKDIDFSRGAKLGMRFKQHSNVVLEAMAGFRERMDSMNSFRKGAELSAENITTLETHRDSAKNVETCAKAIGDGLDAMITKVKGDSTTSTASAILTPEVRTEPVVETVPETAPVEIAVVVESEVVEVQQIEVVSARSKHLQDRLRVAGIA
jgi:phage head maturation protease